MENATEATGDGEAFVHLDAAEHARPLRLCWGGHWRGGARHIEWYAPCGCAYHPEPKPHVHPCAEHAPAPAKGANDAE